jgi:hypothetical protein
MAVSTDLKTPLTLVKDQALSIKIGVPEVKCYNDSGFKELHYRTIPNDNSNEGSIRWANLASVKNEADGDYAIAISMFEYVANNRYPNGFGITLYNASVSGEIIDVPERGRMVIEKNSVKSDSNANIVFRKIVWVSASDLVLGTVAQQKAIEDAEAEKQRKYLESLTNKNTNPLLGNTADSSGLGTWGIIGIVLLFLIGLIWGVIALVKKKKKTNEVSQQQIPVNIIRIPKSS